MIVSYSSTGKLSAKSSCIVSDGEKIHCDQLQNNYGMISRMYKIQPQQLVSIILFTLCTEMSIDSRYSMYISVRVEWRIFNP